MTGTSHNSATLRRVSHRSWRLYRNAKIAHSTGTLTSPRYSSLAQNTLEGISTADASKARVNVHWAMANMSKANGVLPGEARRRHAMAAVPIANPEARRKTMA